MPPSAPLSCYVLTYNSERRLREVLASVSGVVDDLVVLDSGSTDATEAIAREFGARFLYRKFDNFVYQKNHAAQLCRHDWVFELDSDEVVSAALAERIAELKANAFDSAAGIEAFGIRREWFLLGKRVHCVYPSRSPDAPVRIFRKDRVHQATDFSANSRVHHHAVGFSRSRRIDEPLYHYTCDTVEQLYGKLNQYSTLTAADVLSKGGTSSSFKIIVYPWLIWCLYYFAYGGWLDGIVGVIHGRYVRDSVYQKYLKAKYDADLLRARPDFAATSGGGRDEGDMTPLRQ